MNKQVKEYIIKVTGEALDDKGEPLFKYCDEVVRCKDCRFSSEVDWPVNSGIPANYLDCNGELVETWDYYNDEPNYNPVRPNGFCAWGERRE